MTRPRRLTRAEADQVEQQARSEVPEVIEVTAEIRDQPGRMIRNPCGDPETCTHAFCYGDPADAEHVRRTGLPPDGAA